MGRDIAIQLRIKKMRVRLKLTEHQLGLVVYKHQINKPEFKIEGQLNRMKTIPTANLVVGFLL